MESKMKPGKKGREREKPGKKPTNDKSMAKWTKPSKFKALRHKLKQLHKQINTSQRSNLQTTDLPHTRTHTRSLMKILHCKRTLWYKNECYCYWYMTLLVHFSQCEKSKFWRSVATDKVKEMLPYLRKKQFYA